MGLYCSPNLGKDPYQRDLQNLGVYRQEIKKSHWKRNLIIFLIILTVVFIAKTI